MNQHVHHADDLTNEFLMKHFTNQFKLSLVAIKETMEMVKSGAVENDGIINVSSYVLHKITEQVEEADEKNAARV